MGESQNNQKLARTTKSAAEIVAENLETLIAAAPANSRATNTFAKYVGVGNGTIARLRKLDAQARISTLEKIARRFRLEPWQLLIPNLNLDNRPRLFTSADVSRVERALDELRGDVGLPIPPQPEKRVQHRFRRKKP